MNNKIEYARPEIQIIDIECNDVIAQSGPLLDRGTDHEGGLSRSKSFWVD